MYPYDPRNSLITPFTFHITLNNGDTVNMCVGVFDLVIDGTDVLVLSYQVKKDGPWMSAPGLKFIHGDMSKLVIKTIAIWNTWLDKFDQEEQAKLSDLLESLTKEVGKLSVENDRLIYS